MVTTPLLETGFLEPYAKLLLVWGQMKLLKTMDGHFVSLAYITY